MPLAGQGLSRSARRYIEKIGALYDRARSLVVRHFHDDSRLQVWEWHRASAQACVEEASLMYIEGMTALLNEPVIVRCVRSLGAPHFDCRVGAEDPPRSFRVRRSVLMDTPEEREAVERLLGGSDSEVKEAFAEGLRKLYCLGAFQHEHSMTLQPEPEPLPDPAPPSPGTEANP
jgi:hypothetical protein